MMATATFDDYFLKFLRQHGEIKPPVAAIIRDLCQAARSHHSCLALERYEEADVHALRSTSVVGEAGSNTPLVVEGNKLYLHRYFQQEQSVAAMMLTRNRPAPLPADLVTDYLADQFAGTPEPDYQKLAVFQAANRQLTIITGGPGTGKTSVVIRVIDLLLKSDPDLVIKLTAPTGKAAMRLGESIRSATSDAAILDLDVITLHRLLGMRHDGRSWRHGRDNPITADVVIIDEASMVDLAMMERVLLSLPATTRLILLGDPYQLPSVDTGNVLSDLCYTDPEYTQRFCDDAAHIMHLSATPAPAGLANAICRLEKSHRFSADSTIGKFAAAIKAGDAALLTSKDKAITAVSTEVIGQEQVSLLLQGWETYFSLLEAQHPAAGELISAFEEARILCSHRGGDEGVAALNAYIEKELEKRGIKGANERYYEGQPILITRNDYNLRLFNGDIGICVMSENGLLVAFPDAITGLRYFLPSRLPVHETCFAMTVHKSQGSEFNHVNIVLSDRPGDNMDELVTRELIYTAVTRTRKSVALYCSAGAWEAAIARSSRRVSGMADILAASPAPEEGEADRKPELNPNDQLELF